MKKLMFILLLTATFLVHADTVSKPNYLVLVSTTDGAMWITPNNISSVIPGNDGRLTLHMASGRVLNLFETDLYRFSRLVGLELKPY